MTNKKSLLDVDIMRSLNEEYVKFFTVASEDKSVVNLSEFYLNKSFSDVKFIFKDYIVQAHKVVLAAASPHFKTLLSKSEEVEFVMHNVSFPAFENIIQYFYTGSVKFKVEKSELLIAETLQLTQQYFLPSLKQNIIKNVATIVNKNNFVPFLNNVVLFEFDEIRNSCLEFAEANIDELCESGSVYHLSQKALLKLLERHKLPLTEIEIFKIVKEWCEENENDQAVIDCIRLELISMDEILEIVHPSGLIESTKLFDVIRGVRRRQMNKSTVGNNKEQLNSLPVSPEDVLNSSYNSLPANINTSGNQQSLVHGLGSICSNMVQSTVETCINQFNSLFCNVNDNPSVSKRIGSSQGAQHQQQQENQTTSLNQDELSMWQKCKLYIISVAIITVLFSIMIEPTKKNEVIEKPKSFSWFSK